MCQPYIESATTFSDNVVLVHIIVCKIDASGQVDDFDHLHAHLHPDRGL